MRFPQSASKFSVHYVHDSHNPVFLIISNSYLDVKHTTRQRISHPPPSTQHHRCEWRCPVYDSRYAGALLAPHAQLLPNPQRQTPGNAPLHPSHPRHHNPHRRPLRLHVNNREPGPNMPLQPSRYRHDESRSPRLRQREYQTGKCMAQVAAVSWPWYRVRCVEGFGWVYDEGASGGGLRV